MGPREGTLGRYLPNVDVQRPPPRGPPPPTLAPNVPTSGGGGRDLRPRRTSQRQVGGRCTSTLGRYVGNVHWRGPTFPLQRAFATGPVCVVDGWAGGHCRAWQCMLWSGVLAERACGVSLRRVLLVHRGPRLQVCTPTKAGPLRGISLLSVRSVMVRRSVAQSLMRQWSSCAGRRDTRRSTRARINPLCRPRFPSRRRPLECGPRRHAPRHTSKHVRRTNATVLISTQHRRRHKNCA